VLGLDSSEPRYGPVGGSFEDGNKLTSSLSEGNYFSS
jgi:hypothetical protein